ncbi:hypothetical protein KY290_033878 [Solanum tuberosum]|uniref:Secreted protein n=1 Tax=Solanum tuberosum TaxID=4113 RepID=A0ABQ7U241_SOLTU|nr:hypothetical protein KY289_033252 [Solanum tuberosum]KAH0647897.1 hypothetical protein KY285_033145 [Solanum tuberosum]KAH0740835.1 hypothetical protein KY290_033878 [Solanum tuberosum]
MPLSRSRSLSTFAKGFVLYLPCSQSFGCDHGGLRCWPPIHEGLSAIADCHSVDPHVRAVVSAFAKGNGDQPLCSWSKGCIRGHHVT